MHIMMRVRRYLCEIAFIPYLSRTQGYLCTSHTQETRCTGMQVPNARCFYVMPASNKISSTGLSKNGSCPWTRFIVDELQLDLRSKTVIAYGIKDTSRYFTSCGQTNDRPTSTVSKIQKEKRSKVRTVLLVDANSGGIGIDKYVDFGDVHQSEWKGYYLKSIARHNTENISNYESSNVVTGSPKQTRDNVKTADTTTDGFTSVGGCLKSRRVDCALELKNGVGAVVNMAWETLVDVSKLTEEEFQIHLLHRDAVTKSEDLYLDPVTGYYVTTRFAHLKRGECCGNSCRHCPYGLVKVPDEDKKKKHFNSAFYV